jgi:DNA-binding MarR family transcriptional regulator
MPRQGADKTAGASRAASSIAFLLAQVGSHAAANFAKRLEPLDLTPPQAGLLRALSSREGQSQQTLARTLSMVPSKLVGLVDELEERGLVERRDSADDRRVHALYLTRKGGDVLEAIARVARAHDEAICAALSGEERETLRALLRRIADEQGLTPGVHPGFSRLGRSGGTKGTPNARRRRP